MALRRHHGCYWIFQRYNGWCWVFQWYPVWCWAITIQWLVLGIPKTQWLILGIPRMNTIIRWLILDCTSVEKPVSRQHLGWPYRAPELSSSSTKRSGRSDGIGPRYFVLGADTMVSNVLGRARKWVQLLQCSQTRWNSVNGTFGFVVVTKDRPLKVKHQSNQIVR